MDDFTKKSDIQDDLTAKTSLLNSFEYTDTITNDPESTTDWSTVSGTPNAPQDNADKTSENISADTYTVSGRVAGTIADTINSDGTVDTTKLSGAIPQANLNLADRGWVQTCAFSLNGGTPATQVDWGAGTFTSADGTAYSIDAGNTGVMGAKNYIYLDIAVLTTAYQKTTTATTAVGVGKVMVAIAQNGTTEATFQVLQGQGGQNIDAANIVAGSITANEIAASTITSGNMNVSQLSAIAADLGTITAGIINGASIFAGTIFFSKRYIYTAFDSLDAWTQGTSGTGDIANSLGEVRLRTGTTNGSTSQITAGAYSDPAIDFSKNPYFQTRVLLSAITNQTVWIFCGDNGIDIGYGFGFKVVNGTLYADWIQTVGETTTEYSQEITGITLTNYNDFRAVYTFGSKIEFYVNSILKYTATTNLPTDMITPYKFIYYITNSAAAMKILYAQYLLLNQDL